MSLRICRRCGSQHATTICPECEAWDREHEREAPTLPPGEGEDAALAFELQIREAGEHQARLSNVLGRVSVPEAEG